MKKLLLMLAACAGSASGLFAQTLHVTAPGYGAAKLFDSTAGFTITGLGADSAGNVYYLETDAAFPAAASTMLYKRERGAAYGTPTPLFSYGAPLFGAFVVVEAGRVFFGESSGGSIRSINLDGTGLTMLGSVPGIYDLAFSAGSAFLSANPETDFSKPPRNKVYRFDTVTGLTDAILDTGGDYSGPIDFDGVGNLLYGASAVLSVQDLHAFSPTEVAGAFGPTELALSPPSHRLLANGKNAYLGFAGSASLWEDDFSTLTLHDLATPGSQTIANSDHTLGHLDFAAGQLFANVTNFGTGRSTVYSVSAVPEPSAGLLLMSALLMLKAARRRLEASR